MGNKVGLELLLQNTGTTCGHALLFFGAVLSGPLVMPYKNMGELENNLCVSADAGRCKLG